MRRYPLGTLLILAPMALALLGMDGCPFSDTEYVTVGGGEASSGGSSSGDCCGCDGAYFGDDWLWEEEDLHWALHWWTYNEWDGGACVGMVLCNYGPDDYNWEMTLKAFPGVRDVSFFSGAWMDFEGTTINISPMCGDDLPCGNAQEMNFCAEPHVELTKFFIDAEVVEYGDDDDDDDHDHIPPGTLYDTADEVLMSYKLADYGTDLCYDLTFYNYGSSEQDVNPTCLDFSTTVVLTSFWGVAPSAVTNQVLMTLMVGENKLWPGQQFTAQICMEDPEGQSADPRPQTLDVNCAAGP